MKYVCNRCNKVFQADDITIHYITGNNGLEIVAICPSCLEKYLGKTKGDTEQKQDDIERRKMPMKW
jgi:DNA-directed RNA polymerase subunit RPC12/RpoP